MLFDQLLGLKETARAAEEARKMLTREKNNLSKAVVGLETSLWVAQRLVEDAERTVATAEEQIGILTDCNSELEEKMGTYDCVGYDKLLAEKEELAAKIKALEDKLSDLNHHYQQLLVTCEQRERAKENKERQIELVEEQGECMKVLSRSMWRNSESNGGRLRRRGRRKGRRK